MQDQITPEGLLAQLAEEDELDRIVSAEFEHRCVNPNCPCALCPLGEVCAEDYEIPDELIAQAETACGM
jgi:hypothetical protein